MRTSKQLLVKASVIATIFVVSFSCDFGDTNVDPALPPDASLSSILSSGEAALSWAIGGECVRSSGIFTQQFEGTNAQQQDQTKYLVTESSVDGVWARLYNSSLNTCNVLSKKAKTEKSPHYEGVAKVLIARGMMALTDAFGDVPYSEAFKGDEEVYTPSYDTQEKLYTETLPTLLDEAVALLGQAESLKTPSADDFIYGGDMEKWRRAANSLKVKIILQTSKRDENAYKGVLDLLSSDTLVMSSNEDDFEMRFGTADNEVGPQYQFSQDRSGNLKMAPYFVGQLSGDDTRKDFFVGKNEDGKYNHDGNFAFPGYYTRKNSPVVLMSYVELKFIEAESHLMKSGSDQTAAKAALDAAVEASFMKITGAAAPAAYKTGLDESWASAATQEEKLEVLIGEKYIACYSQGLVAWNDYRRTGYPAITPNEEGEQASNPRVNGQVAVPRRLPYPQEERLLNADNIPIKVPNLQARFWWDDAN